MEPLWKQFVGSATASRHKVFFWARLKLTATYALILSVIVIGFSLVLFQNIARNLNDMEDTDFTAVQVHDRFVHDTLENLQAEIALLDLIVVLVATAASYGLAGYTLRPIQLAMEAQRKFAENASHELRTPLAVMRNDMAVLLRAGSPNPEAVRRTLTSNIEEVDRMTTMTEDLLALARSENKKPLSLHHLNFSEVIQQTAGKLRSLAHDKGIELLLEPGDDIQILGNRSALERIATNVIKNAIEHTAQGTVAVSVTREHTHALLYVSDTGAGIPERDVPHVYERFYKGERSSGTGLGLAIVRELVDQHHGHISISSREGEGTVVRIEFPNGL